jgi:hypothetical protein
MLPVLDGHNLTVDILLNNGANVNQATLNLHSVPLEMAAEKGHEEYQRPDGVTPLFMASHC